MPLVAGIVLPAGIDIIYNKTLKMYDISVHCNIGKNPRFLPRYRRYAIRELSWLLTIAYAWANLTDSKREEWNFAANVLGWHGYNLYVQDKAYRIKNAIGGDAEPDIYHQFKVGHVGIGAPSSSAEIMFADRHRFYPPGEMSICTKTNFVASGDNPSVKIILQVHRYYTGQNLQDDYEIDLPLIKGWDKSIVKVFQKIGYEGRWEVRIVLTDVVGDLWFDNISVLFNGTDQNPDPFCDNVIDYWEPANVGAGVSFGSIYPTGSAL